MSKKGKDKYKQFHQKIAEDFGTTEQIISKLRSINRGGEGLSPLEMKLFLSKKISLSQIEISKILANIKKNSDALDYLNTVSEKTVNEMLEIKSKILKDDNKND